MKKSDSIQKNIQGTLDTYLSKHIVGGMSYTGQKRKVGVTCDDFPVEEKNNKRFKPTMTPGTERRGPKSSTEDEPGCVHSEFCTNIQEVPRDLTRKSLLPRSLHMSLTVCSTKTNNLYPNFLKRLNK